MISFATVTLFFGGSVKGWSAAVGGAIAVIGSMTYAMLVVRGSSDAKKAFRAHVPVGHSMGALTLWQYIRDFGTSRISKVCFIDQSQNY